MSLKIHEDTHSVGWYVLLILLSCFAIIIIAGISGYFIGREKCKCDNISEGQYNPQPLNNQEVEK